MSLIRIGITGHRTLKDPSRVEQEIERTIRKILDEKNATSFIAYSGMAYGADTVFAKVARHRFSAELMAILPFNAGEYEKDFDKEESLAEFRSLYDELDQDHIKIISTNSQGDDRIKAYWDTGKYIVDNCDVLIAIWDGRPPKGRGGTTDIIDYCIEKNKPLYLISPEEGLLMYDDPAMFQLYKDITSKYYFYDQVANEAQQVFNSYWHFSVYLSIFSVLCLAIPVVIAFGSVVSFVFAAMEVISILSLLMMIRTIQNKRMHGRRIYTRMAAERLRILKLFCVSGLPVDRRIFEINFGKEEEIIQGEIAGLELILNNLLSNRSYLRGTAEPNLEFLLRHQLNYHTKRLFRNNAKLERYNAYKTWIKWFFLGGLFYHLLVTTLDLPKDKWISLLHWPGILLTLCLPPVYAAIEGFIYFNEWERTEKHSKLMKDFFERKLNQLKNETPDIDMLAFEIREEMLKENENWELLLLDKKKPNEL